MKYCKFTSDREFRVLDGMFTGKEKEKEKGKTKKEPRVIFSF